jgi:hypothetical protein
MFSDAEISGPKLHQPCICHADCFKATQMHLQLPSGSMHKKFTATSFQSHNKLATYISQSSQDIGPPRPSVVIAKANSKCMCMCMCMCIALQGCSTHHQVAVDAIHLACFEDVTSKGDLIAAAATTVCCININPSANRVASSRVRPLAPYRRNFFLRMSLVLLDMCCWHCKSGCCRTALKMVF